MAVFVQQNAPRLYAAFVFVGVTLLHDVAFSHLDGIAYYGSAALLDLAIMILLSGVHPLRKTVIRLQVICLISIIANMLGWLIWFVYLPPTAYNFTFFCLYLWALVELLKKDRDNVGGFTVDSWRACIRFDRSAWAVRLFKNGGEI